MKGIIKNKALLSLWISFLIFSFIIIFIFFWIWKFSNFSLKDYYYKYLDSNSLVSQDIVVVEIDDQTQSSLWRFPFDRKVYSKLISNLNNAWAEVIWLDIMFPDKTNTASDYIFSTSISKWWNVVLGYYIDSKSKEAKWPLDKFEEKAYSVWLLNPPVEKESQKVYFVWPQSKFGDIVLEPFSFSLLKSYYAKLYLDDSYKYTWFFSKNNAYYSLIEEKGLHVPLSENQRYYFSYNSSQKFNQLSFIDVYNWDNLPDLTWKIVIVWPASDWQDYFYSPIWRLYGVYIHANIINSILTKTNFIEFSRKIEILMILMVIIFSVYLNIWVAGRKLILWNILVFILIVLIFSIPLFSSAILNYPLYFLIAWVLSVLFSNIIRYLIEDFQKNKLLKALSEYVSKDIAKNILSWAWAINLNWEKKQVAVMFSDIKWFTTISENLKPEDLVSFLRKYLWEMSHIIMDNRWYIDKYEWDAVMAIWGAFWTSSEFANVESCLDSVLSQQYKLKELNLYFEEIWLPKIFVRFGVNFWEAILWNIWADWRKVEFTALWDNVNLASRLEWINKVYWTSICVSESVYLLWKDKYRFRFLDNVKVKWKDTPVRIYELLWVKWAIEDYKLSLMNDYKKALDLYLDWNFNDARDIFLKLDALWDKPSSYYLGKCNNFIENPPMNDDFKINKMFTK